MGCLSSAEAQNDFEANEEFDDEEKEAKPTSDKNYGDEIPEMNVNQLGSSNQPLKSDNQQIQVTQYQNNNNNNNNDNNMNRRGMAQQASVLNNFNNNNNNRNNYDVNQYHSPGSEHSTASKDYSDDNNNQYRNNIKNGIPEHRMMDSHGNVHVNKFYNVTRNHNLSNASKLTDLSEMPSVAQMQNPAQIQSQHGGHGSNDMLNMAGYQHMHNLSVMNNNGLSPVQYGQSGGHKMSVDSHASATTNGSKMLWDDFSDRGSVMTADTETV